MNMEVLVSRPYEEGDIYIQQTDVRRTSVPEVDERIRKNLENLETEIAEARTRGLQVVLYDSPISTVRKIEENGGRLLIETGLTGYKELLGIRPADEVLKKFVRKEYVINTSTLGTVVELADDKIPITTRQDYMMGILANSLGLEMPVYHLPSGFVNPSDSSDPRAAVRRHILKDLFNVTDGRPFEVKANKLLGAVYSPTADEVYFCFNTKLHERSTELTPRGKLYFVDNTRSGIREFIGNPPEGLDILYEGLSALLLHLTHNWGENEIEKIGKLH